MTKYIRKIIRRIRYVEPISVLSLKKYTDFYCTKLIKIFIFNEEKYYIREYRFNINPNNNYYTFIELIKDMYV